MNILSFLFKRQEPTEGDILNTGLRLLMKSNFDSIKSIQESPSNKYPFLTDSKLNYYEQKCKNAKECGHSLVYETMVKRLKAKDPMTKNELREIYKSGIMAKFPWVNKSNFRSIYNLACYGLVHDGWGEFKKE